MKSLSHYKIQKVLIIVIGLCLMLCFQNCGRDAVFSEIAGKLTDPSGQGGGPLVEDIVEDESDDPADVDDQVLNAVECNDFLSHKDFEQAEPDGVYTNIDSNLLLIASENIQEISGIDGNVKIYAEQPIEIQSLSNIDGNVILCGAAVLDANGLDGNLKVYGADVGNVSNVDGNIDVYNGKIVGNVNFIGGNIDVTNGSIDGDVTNVDGNIREHQDQEEEED